jgi:hypothetical protein
VIVVLAAAVLGPSRVKAQQKRPSIPVIFGDDVGH